MDLEIREERTGEVEISTAVPEGLQENVLQNADPYVLEGPGLLVLLQELKGDGFSVWLGRYQMEQPSVLRARANLPALELRIALKNQIEGTWEKIAVPSLKEYFFNLSFTPHVLTRAIFQGGKEYLTFDIHFEPAFLSRLGIDYQTLERFLHKVPKQEPAELSPLPHPCSVEMVSAVDAILHNNYSARAQGHLLECKVKEILIAALEIMGRDELVLPVALRPHDIEKLYEARSVILEHMPEWATPGLICRKTGLNELKLKIGFRHLFGITPYDYYVQLKMKEAKRLLLDGTESITSIAYLTGYEHLSSFSREFKKAFGFSPGYFRKHGHY